MLHLLVSSECNYHLHIVGNEVIILIICNMYMYHIDVQ